MKNKFKDSSTFKKVGGKRGELGQSQFTNLEVCKQKVNISLNIIIHLEKEPCSYKTPSVLLNIQELGRFSQNF